MRPGVSRTEEEEAKAKAGKLEKGFRAAHNGAGRNQPCQEGVGKVMSSAGGRGPEQQRNRT